MLTARVRVVLITLSTCLLFSCTSSDEEASVAISTELKSLEVTGASGTVYPAFDSKTRHYGVRCDPADVLQVSVSTDNASQVLTVDNLQLDPGSLAFEIANPEDGQDVVVNVSQDGSSDSYTLHCIPDDMPEIEILLSTPDADEGLLYVSPQYVEAGERRSYLIIMDNNGVPRFQRKINGRVLDFKAHPNGLYTYALSIGPNAFNLNDSEIVVLDPLFEEINRLRTVGLTHTDNHDFIFTPEGSHIFISYNSTTRDMTAFGLSSEEIVGDSVIQEVDENGAVVFEWNSWDHIDITDCQNSGYPRFPADYGHLNAIDLTAGGDLIASFRGCAQVLKINRPGGSVEWFLGGSQSDFLITGDPFNEFCGQHTARELENGNIIMFDNGSFCLGDRQTVFGDFSRALEYSLDIVAEQAMYVRDYSLNGTYQEFTRSQGSVQVLPNSNWLMGWGNGPDVSVTEVNTSGEKVFEARFSIDGAALTNYRAFKSATPGL